MFFLNHLFHILLICLVLYPFLVGVSVYIVMEILTKDSNPLAVVGEEKTFFLSPPRFCGWGPGN